MKITGCCLPYGESKYQYGEKVPLVHYSYDKDNPENVIGHCMLHDTDEGFMCDIHFNENCLGKIKIEEEKDNVIKEFPEDTPDGKIDESRWVEVKNENVLLPCYTCAKCGGETTIRYPFCPYCKRTMTNSTIETRMNSL